MRLTSALVKQIDANWAAGTNQGGFPSGLVLAADTTYRIYLISNGSTVDAGFDTSSTAANLLADASGYTYYREIGFFRTDGSADLDYVGFLLPRFEVFTANGTWYKPDQCVYVEAVVIGGGGGGAGNGGGSGIGTAGGNSSFGSHMTANGGAGGTPSGGSTPAGGTGSGGFRNTSGEDGQDGAGTTGGDGGASGGAIQPWFDSTPGIGGDDVSGQNASDYGAGGAGFGDAVAGWGHGGGGGACVWGLIYAYNLGTSETITVGTGGAGFNGTDKDGGDGSDGIVLIRSF
jgi:hypothetical protein